MIRVVLDEELDIENIVMASTVSTESRTSSASPAGLCVAGQAGSQLSRG